MLTGTLGLVAAVAALSCPSLADVPWLLQSTNYVAVRALLQQVKISLAARVVLRASRSSVAVCRCVPQTTCHADVAVATVVSHMEAPAMSWIQRMISWRMFSGAAIVACWVVDAAHATLLVSSTTSRCAALGRRTQQIGVAQMRMAVLLGNTRLAV